MLISASSGTATEIPGEGYCTGTPVDSNWLKHLCLKKPQVYRNVLHAASVLADLYQVTASV